jgi:hypothetical protein
MRVPVPCSQAEGTEPQTASLRSLSSAGCSLAGVPVSLVHEALVALFRNRPELAPELLREALHAQVPAYTEARIESADLTEIDPAELRADLVVLLVDDTPVLAIVVEVQLAVKPRKRYTWPAYVAGVRARFQCAACVLVVTPFEAVARWAHDPIELGPGATLLPMVVGPAAVPVIREVARAAEAPELAVLSAMAHGAALDVGAAVAFAAAAASWQLPEDRAALYWDLIQASLSDATRAALEDIMSAGHYEYQSEFAKRYFAEGKAEGKAEGVLRVLAARGIAISEVQKRRVTECTDLRRLDQWLERSVTADSAEAIFADES